jgi:hypothetical protein
VTPKIIGAPPLFEQEFEKIYESQGTGRQAFDTSDIATEKNSRQESSKRYGAKGMGRQNIYTYTCAVERYSSLLVDTA